MEISELDIDFLSQRLADNARSPLFARLADLYLARGQSPEALTLCEEGTKNFPSYSAGFIVLGRCYRALGHTSEAREALEHALHLSPFNEVAKALLAEISNPENEMQEVHDEFVPISEAEGQTEQSSYPEQIEAGDHPGIAQEMQTSEPETEPELPVTDDASPADEGVSVTTETDETIPLVDDYINQHLADSINGTTMSLDEYLSTPPTVAGESGEQDEIGKLAEQLQNANHIITNENEQSSLPPDSLGAEPDIVTPTLAEIYASQGQYNAAIQAYEILMLSKPDDREKFEARIKELQAKMYESDGQA